MDKPKELTEEELAKKFLEVVDQLGARGVNACHAAFRLLDSSESCNVDEFQLNYMTYFELQGEGGE